MYILEPSPKANISIPSHKHNISHHIPEPLTPRYRDKTKLPYHIPQSSTPPVPTEPIPLTEHKIHINKPPPPNPYPHPQPHPHPPQPPHAHQTLVHLLKSHLNPNPPAPGTHTKNSPIKPRAASSRSSPQCIHAIKKKTFKKKTK